MEWLDAQEASEYLGVSVNTVYRLIESGRLPALRFPVRIDRRHLDRRFDLCRIKPGELAHLHRPHRQAREANADPAQEGFSEARTSQARAPVGESGKSPWRSTRV